MCLETGETTKFLEYRRCLVSLVSGYFLFQGIVMASPVSRCQETRETIKSLEYGKCPETGEMTKSLKYSRAGSLFCHPHTSHYTIILLQSLIPTIRSNFLTEAPGQYTGGMQMQGQGQMMQVQS